MENTILVVDLEATCADDGTILPDAMEVIEIGACWTFANGAVFDEFQMFVRPIKNPVLTPFCCDLTGIQQQHVENAKSFAEAAVCLAEFASRHVGQHSIWMSWGSYDFKQLARDSERQLIANPISLPHENAKRTFAKVQKIGKEVGLAKACELTGLGMLGSHHRALDDARNVARLLPWVFGVQSIRESRQPPTL